MPGNHIYGLDWSSGLMPNLQARKHKKKDTTAILFAMWNWRITQLIETKINIVFSSIEVHGFCYAFTNYLFCYCGIACLLLWSLLPLPLHACCVVMWIYFIVMPRSKKNSYYFAFTIKSPLTLTLITINPQIYRTELLTPNCEFLKIVAAAGWRACTTTIRRRSCLYFPVRD